MVDPVAAAQEQVRQIHRGLPADESLDDRWSDLVPHMLLISGREQAEKVNHLVVTVGTRLLPLLVTLFTTRPRFVTLIVPDRLDDVDGFVERVAGELSAVVNDFSGYCGKWLKRHPSLDWLRDAETPTLRPSIRLARHDGIEPTADPSEVYRSLEGDYARWTNDAKENVLVEITGAKKPIVIGAYQFAASHGWQLGYVDFEKYDPFANAPDPATCRWKRITDPTAVFALPYQRALREAFESGRFDVAKALLVHLKKHTADVTVAPYFDPAPGLLQRELDAVHVFDLWQQRYLYRARQQVIEKGWESEHWVPPILLSDAAERSEIDVLGLTADAFVGWALDSAEALCRQAAYDVAGALVVLMSVTSMSCRHLLRTMRDVQATEISTDPAGGDGAPDFQVQALRQAADEAIFRLTQSMLRGQRVEVGVRVNNREVQVALAPVPDAPALNSFGKEAPRVVSDLTYRRRRNEWVHSAKPVPAAIIGVRAPNWASVRATRTGDWRESTFRFTAGPLHGVLVKLPVWQLLDWRAEGAREIVLEVATLTRPPEGRRYEPDATGAVGAVRDNMVTDVPALAPYGAAAQLLTFLGKICAAYWQANLLTAEQRDSWDKRIEGARRSEPPGSVRVKFYELEQRLRELEGAVPG